jgi:predicted alpha/beta superfamily hydrolase
MQVSTGNGTMRPFLLVGVENTQRRRDMTGPTTNAEDRKIAPQVGGSAAFRAFFRDELMPAINARYRTTGETAIVGESLAGLFVVETLMLEPALFGTYIAFDPSLWWNNAALAADLPAAKPAWTGKRLFLAVSSNGDRGDAFARFVAALEQKKDAGLSWSFEAMPGETHATIYHPAALKAFRTLFKPGS